MKFKQNLMATSITLVLTVSTKASGFYKEKKKNDHNHIQNVGLEHSNDSFHQTDSLI